MVKEIPKKKYLEISTESADILYRLIELESMPRTIGIHVGSGVLTVKDMAGYGSGFTRSVPAFTPNTKPDEPSDFFLGRNDALSLFAAGAQTVMSWYYTHSPLVLRYPNGMTMTVPTCQGEDLSGLPYGPKAVGQYEVPATMFRAAVDPLAASLVRIVECSNGHLFGDGWMTAVRSRVPLDLPDWSIRGDAAQALKLFDRDGKPVTVAVTQNHVKFSQAHFTVYFARLAPDNLLPSAVMKGLLTGKAYGIDSLPVVMAKAASKFNPDFFEPVATITESFALSAPVLHEVRERLGSSPVEQPDKPQYTLYLSEARPLQTIVVSNDLVDIAAPATG